MRRLIVPLALLAMGLLLGVAVVIDCVRLARDAQNRVLVTDGAMVTQEIRFAKQLEGNAKTGAAVRAAIEKFKAIHTRQERMAAYDELVVAFRNSASEKIDPNNQLDRKFLDEATGAINRRDVAQKQNTEEQAVYEAFMNSWRGKLAAFVSTGVRRDAERWGK